MDVYDRIDQLLKDKGISRRKAAKMAEIPPTTLNGAITRKKGLSASALSALTKALDIDEGFLLRDSAEIQKYLNEYTVDSKKARTIYLDGLDDEDKRAIDTLTESCRKKAGLRDHRVKEENRRNETRP